MHCRHCNKYHKAIKDDCWSNLANKREKQHAKLNKKGKGTFKKNLEKFQCTITTNIIKNLKVEKAREQCNVDKVVLSKEAAFANSILTNFVMSNLDNLKNNCKRKADTSEIDLITNGNFFDYSTINKCLTYSKDSQKWHVGKKIKQNHWTVELSLQMQDKNGKLVPVWDCWIPAPQKQLCFPNMSRRAVAKATRVNLCSGGPW